MIETVFFSLILVVELSISAVIENEYQVEFDFNTIYTTSNESYRLGIDLGIINPEKYSFDEFLNHEVTVFKDKYKQFVAANYTTPLNYTEWLVVNNFGVLPDTQESLFKSKITKGTADNKRQFVKTVRKGDILVTGHGVGGLIGHAAIMTTDYWVLEMPGGSGWENGIPDNNRQVPKDQWFDLHAEDWTTVYRCPDSSVAAQAASWADHHYYNFNGGKEKTIHIEYKITTDIWSINPSYCSKLVIHAYYFGTGSKKVIKDLSVIGRLIIPTTIPSYFLSPYQLLNKGKY